MKEEKKEGTAPKRNAVPTPNNIIVANAKNANSIKTAPDIVIENILEPFIFEGVNLVVGEPRTGKTWLMLEITSEIENEYNILYFSEDSEAVIQARLKKMPGNFKSVNFVFRNDLTTTPPIEEIYTGAEAMQCKIVIIDTLSLILQQARDLDFIGASAIMQKIKEQMKVHQVKATIITHHTRKRDSTKNNTELSFDDIHGTQGLRATVDSVMLTQHYESVSNQYRLLVTVETKIRDMEVAKYIIETSNYHITNIQDAKAVIEQSTENIVLHYITKMHETGESTTPKNIIQTIRADRQEISENLIRVSLTRLKATGKIEKKGTQYIPT